MEEEKRAARAELVLEEDGARFETSFNCKGKDLIEFATRTVWRIAEVLEVDVERVVSLITTLTCLRPHDKKGPKEGEGEKPVDEE